MDSPTFTVGLPGIIMPSNAAVENTCPTAAQDIHAFGEQEQNSLSSSSTNPRTSMELHRREKAGETTCTANEFAGRISFDERRFRPRVG